MAIDDESVGGETIYLLYTKTLTDRSPNVIKIDVEGAELAVLDGLSETLASADCRAIFVEIHHNHGVSTDAVEDRLRTAGFETTVLDGRGGTTFLRAASSRSAQ